MKAQPATFPAPPKRLDPRDVLTLYRLGACVGEDPALFEATAATETVYGLAICLRCPVLDLCREVMRPAQTFYDGVCAGEVFVNGVPVSRSRRSRRRSPNGYKPTINPGVTENVAVS